MNKMDYINFDNDFDKLLLRWFDGDLYGQELSDFEADPRFIEYQQIGNNARALEVPRVDQDALLSKIKDRIKEAPATNVIPLWKKLTSIAAIAITVLGVLTLFSADVSVDSHHAIQLSHALPDGSQIILNSDSEIKYDDDFDLERTLYLEGEAFFQVEKGESFTVVTDEGKVLVLGTSFNVLAREGVFVVSCKTGKVQVSSKTQSKIITPGERVRFSNGIASVIEKVDPDKIDNWTSGESYFERTPLIEVISSLSHKYDVEIDLPTAYHGKLFTGSFIHSDMKKAMKMVLVPMGIKYEVNDNGVVKISK
ncbi:MAG: transmembrane sensor [Saprospiraceae bacterium]|jgi:transmembrane sensor|tara:strand:+ start:43 stop:969 length:927 start_codon:yes stop_codon:yes gene_type:complete